MNEVAFAVAVMEAVVPQFVPKKTLGIRPELSP